jgi:hypothetical protein
MIKQIVSQFNIPASCKIDKKLYKKQFLENFKLKSDEKRAIKEHVESIELLYLLNTQNINIEPYTTDEVDYSEVAYIHLKLSNDKHYKKLAHIVQYIPYMVVLLISYEDRFCINISTKRINQNDKTKLITDEEYFTDWIDINNPNEKEKAFLQSLQLQNQSFVNFKSFYNDLLQKVVALKLSKHTPSLITPKERSKETLAKITQLQEQIKEMEKRIKKETHFNEKVSLNVELKKLHDKLYEIKKSI